MSTRGGFAYNLSGRKAKIHKRKAENYENSSYSFPRYNSSTFEKILRHKKEKIRRIRECAYGMRMLCAYSFFASEYKKIKICAKKFLLLHIITLDRMRKKVYNNVLESFSKINNAAN